MPNTKSAIRALRQNIRRRETNRAKKKELKAVIKNYKKAAGEKGDEAGEKLKLVYKKLDKAARIGQYGAMIHLDYPSSEVKEKNNQIINYNFDL